jgi:hypothetical protein
MKKSYSETFNSAIIAHKEPIVLEALKGCFRVSALGTYKIDMPIFSHEEKASFRVTFGSDASTPVSTYRYLRQRGYDIEAAYFNPFKGFGGVYVDGKDHAWNFPNDNTPAWPVMHPKFEEHFSEWQQWFPNVHGRLMPDKAVRQRKRNTKEVKPAMAVAESSEDVHDKHWKMIRAKWPQFNAIDVAIRNVKTLASRFGIVYCRAEWFKGPEEMTGNPLILDKEIIQANGIVNMGFHRAATLIMDAHDIPYPHIPTLIAAMLPSCDHPDCKPECRNGYLKTT